MTRGRGAGSQCFQRRVCPGSRSRTFRDSEGAPTIVVNNAGITRDNLLLMRMKADEWDDVISTNLSGVFRVSKAVLRGMMKAKGGRIINIASVIGSHGECRDRRTMVRRKPESLVLVSHSRGKLVRRNITVNVVAPGFIDTDMTRVLPEEQKRGAMLTQVPLGQAWRRRRKLPMPWRISRVRRGRLYHRRDTVHVNGGMLMD